MKKFKKTAVSLTAAVLSVFMLSVPSYALESSQIMGDVNGDGKINIVDVTAVRRHIAKLRMLDDEAIARAKVCSYERLSILDATALQRYLAGFIKQFPADNTEKETVAKVKNKITIYLTNNKNWSTVNARFLNHKTGESVNAEMRFLEKNSDGEDVYSATVDVTKYDRVVFGDGTVETTDTPVTKASSGYYIRTEDKKYNGKLIAGIYTYNQQIKGNIDTVEMDYPDGYDKKVYIWTPEGYNPKDKSKKYSVLYMTDGQNLFDQFHSRAVHRWRCDETALSLMDNGGDGVIIVGVASSGQYRFNELTPNIGSLTPAIPELPDDVSLNGETFSDFIVNDVVPYVENNYNTNSIRGIAGSSSGGIEAFYIGIEHPDKFSYVGAISPAFDLFEEDVWENYFSTKSFKGKVPRMYLYCGNSDFVEQLQYKGTVLMDSQLKALGYPTDKLTTVLDEDGAHNEDFWAIYFPDMLSYGLQY